MRFRLAFLLLAVLVLCATSAVAWAAKGELSFQQRLPEFGLGAGHDLVASPDGSSLYASDGTGVTVLSRDPASGEFEFLEKASEGLSLPFRPGRGMAVSPDGTSLYLAARVPDHAVVAFERDQATGRLTFLEREKEGVDDPEDPGGTVDGLSGIEALAVAPDGKSVYAVSHNDNSIVAFERDSDGSISYLETETHGVDDPGDAGGVVTGLDGGTDIAVSPDGEGVYATASDSDSLAAFERDPSSGELSFVESERDGVKDPSDAGETVEGLGWARSVAIGPSGDYVYAAGDFANALAVFKRDASSQQLEFVEAEVNGVDDPGDAGPTVSGLIFPSSIAVSPDGANLYAAALGSVVNFDLSEEAGVPVFVESEAEGVDSENGSALAIPAAGEFLYVAGAGGIAAFDREKPGDPSLGRLDFRFKLPELSLISPRGAAITPDGTRMVVATLGDRSLRSFARNPATGVISAPPLDSETQEVDDPSDPGPEVRGLEEPKAVAIAPNGTDVYVTDTSEYAISLFKLDPASGELTYVESEFDGVNDPSDPGGEVEGLYEPWDIEISPDGRGVYVAADADDAVAVFDRDLASGELSFVEAHVDGESGVDGLHGVQGIAISPDGLNLYGAGRDTEEAAVFARDPATNELDFLEVEKGGVDDPGDAGGPVDGFDSGPQDVIVSRDGANVYFGGSAISRFQRDQATGRISFAEVERNEVDDPTDAGGVVEGLAAVRKLELSRDGGELYAGSSSGNGSLAVFSLVPGSGALSFLGAEFGGVDDPGSAGGVVAGLAGLEDLLISPDDRFLYSVAEDGHGLGVFVREQAPPPPAPLPPPALVAPPLPAPAPIARRADTALLGPVFRAAKRQRQKGRQIVVTLTLGAGERAIATGFGKVSAGKRSYRLKKVSTRLAAGKAKTLRLKPAKANQRLRIAAELRRGGKVTARVTGRIVDPAGNRRAKTLNVRLTQPQPRR